VPPPELVEFSEARHLTIQRLCLTVDPESMLASGLPAVIAWDVASATSDDWLLIRRLHNHPLLHQTPFIFYQHEPDGTMVSGLTSLVVKPASSDVLWEAIRPTLSNEPAGSVIIIDDDAHARSLAHDAVSRGLPAYTIVTADNGRSGLEAILANAPNLVILDLMMPEMDGFEVLEQMRADQSARQVPVVILSGRQLSLDDVKRLEQHTSVTLRSKDLFTEAELITSLHQTLFDTSGLPPHTSALAKRTVAYLHQNFDRALSRDEIAQELGVSEDYLSRIFNQELGISPWDYLNRYRIARARELLRQSYDGIAEIGRRVGYSDPAYFSRVFRKITGMSASEFREHPYS
jgi:AraC-like DNA-binding protein